jgi:Lrp/AsnC family transcriptional regulator, leucine-responsive regulatory protein
VTETAAADQGAVMSQLCALPEVEDVVVVTGSFGMLARLRVRGHLRPRRFLLERIWQLDGIQRTDTFPVARRTTQQAPRRELLADAAAEGEAL